MEGDATNTGELAMSLTGTLTATVLSAADKSRTLSLEVAPERIDLQRMALGISAEALKQELARPFQVTYDENGAAQAVAFPATVGRQASTLLRDIVSQLQVTVRPGASWIAVESEPAGDCAVGLRRLAPGRIAKQKVRFVKVARSGVLVDSDDTIGVPTFERSEATYDVDASGRVLAAEVHHVMQAKVDVVAGSVRSEVHATFSQVTTSAASPTAAPPPVVARARPLSDSPEDVPTAEAVRDLPAAAEVVAGMRRQNAARDPGALHEAQHLLSRSVASDPKGTLAELRKEDLEQQPVLSAIGSAGTPEAQAALTKIANDPKQPLEVRKQAIDAFHEVPDATPESADHLLELADKDPKLRENALLALGGLANRKAQTDPDTAGGWVDQIVAMYQRATSDEERLMLLDALGNSGQEAALDILKDVLASGSPALRVAAAKNLRLLPAPRADQLLGTLLSPQIEPEIREAALFAAGFRQFENMQQALAALVQEEPSVEVRMAALGALSTYLRRDEAAGAATLIRWLADNDPDGEVREEASRVLKG
jgi:HEAT repeat protein